MRVILGAELVNCEPEWGCKQNYVCHDYHYYFFLNSICSIYALFSLNYTQYITTQCKFSSKIYYFKYLPTLHIVITYKINLLE